jgi:outer membrane protein OmpA-like peptidoglycan-associated protein
MVILGAKLAALLAADGLLSAALAFVGSLTLALTPLLALAALAFGIVVLWDTFKSVLRIIGGAVQLVLDTIRSIVATILDTIKELAIELRDLAVFLGGLIKEIAESIAEALLAAGRGILAGAKWIGRGIASAAETVWDWLFGSDVEPMPPPKFEPPITEEPTMHCGTVAREDALIQIDSDLLFPFGEWELTKLTPKGHLALIAAAAKVVLTPRTSDDPVRFLGYTDVIGDFDRNQWLSEQRAGAVADWFVQNGVIPMSQVKITGFGKTEARAKPDDEEGRKKDRRVDILVTKKGSGEQVCW